MFTELINELIEAPWIFVLVLHPGRPRAVNLAIYGHGIAFDPVCSCVCLRFELGPFIRLRPISATSDNERMRSVRMVKSKMKRGKPTH